MSRRERIWVSGPPGPEREDVGNGGAELKRPPSIKGAGKRRLSLDPEKWAECLPIKDNRN